MNTHSSEGQTYYRRKDDPKSRPPYLLGLLGIIPLVGAFVGVGLILYGIIRYQSTKLVIVGVVCILFTVAVYGGLFYGFKHSKIISKGFEPFAKADLNTLVAFIEYHKVETGSYPDSLGELRKYAPFLHTSDMLNDLLPSKGEEQDYRYEKIGQKYTLYSVGHDGHPNTADDMYPSIGWDSTRFGLIRDPAAIESFRNAPPPLRK